MRNPIQNISNWVTYLTSVLMRQILTQLHILTSDLWPIETGKNKVWHFKLKHHFVSLFYYQCHFLTQTFSFVHRFSAHNLILLLAKLFNTMNWKIKIFENNFMFCIYFTLLFLHFFPKFIFAFSFLFKLGVIQSVLWGHLLMTEVRVWLLSLFFARELRYCEEMHQNNISQVWFDKVIKWKACILKVVQCFVWN